MGVFSHCKNLVSVEFREGLEKIGKESFCCSALETIHIPASVQSIEHKSFFWCSNLQQLTFAENS